MGYSTILLEHRDGIATLTLNRPEARNAIDLVMREELAAALDEIEADSRTRARCSIRFSAWASSAGSPLRSFRPNGTVRLTALWPRMLHNYYHFQNSTKEIARAEIINILNKIV